MGGGLQFIKRLPRGSTEVNSMGYIKLIYSFMAPSKGHQSFQQPSRMIPELQAEVGCTEDPGHPKERQHS